MRIIVLQTPFGEIGVNPDHIEAITPYDKAAIVHFASKETLVISLSLEDVTRVINTR